VAEAGFVSTGGKRTTVKNVEAAISVCIHGKKANAESVEESTFVSMGKERTSAGSVEGNTCVFMQGSSIAVQNARNSKGMYLVNVLLYRDLAAAEEITPVLSIERKPSEDEEDDDESMYAQRFNDK
jgi:hypothetical protein